jgi:hypothetical protein
LSPKLCNARARGNGAHAVGRLPAPRSRCPGGRRAGVRAGAGCRHAARGEQRRANRAACLASSFAPPERSQTCARRLRAGARSSCLAWRESVFSCAVRVGGCSGITSASNAGGLGLSFVLGRVLPRKAEAKTQNIGERGRGGLRCATGACRRAYAPLARFMATAP